MIRCAKCPACKEPLIARDTARRFMENDTYAECVRGHVWELVNPRTGIRHGAIAPEQREARPLTQAEVIKRTSDQVANGPLDARRAKDG